MGRAIVRDPAAFLMDEPLSNLDAKLRVQTRTEVSRLQQRLGTTMVYVTHDQTEAMTLGDRVAVMRIGMLQQVGVAAGTLRPAGQPVRGRLHRLARDELHGRHPGGRQAAHRAGRHPARPASCGRRWSSAGTRPGRDRRASARRTSRTRRWCPPRTGSNGITFPRHHRRGGVAGLGDVRLLHPGARAGRETRRAGRAGPGLRAGRHRRSAETVVARLDPATRITEGENAELWVDVRAMHVFDPATGREPHAVAARAGARTRARPHRPAGGSSPAAAAPDDSAACEDTGSSGHADRGDRNCCWSRSMTSSFHSWVRISR